MTVGIPAEFVCPQGRHSKSTPGRPTFPAIPGYAILADLGRGRASVIYEARELPRGRRVALEVIESERNGTSAGDCLVHFDADATRLHHPNIVAVLSPVAMTEPNSWPLSS